MKPTSTLWRSGAWLALGLVNTTAFAQQSGAYPVQSLDAIRKAAQAFVQERIPGEPNTVEVAVGSLDERLRLAQCDKPLEASLPSGASFRDKTTVAVTC